MPPPASFALFLSPLPPTNSLHPPPPPPRQNPHHLLLRPSPTTSSSKTLLPLRVHCLLYENAQEKDTIPRSPPMEKPWMQPVKMPTPPWTRAPLPLPAGDAPDLSKGVHKKPREDRREDPSLTEKVRGGRNRKAMRRIVERIARLRQIDPVVVEEEEEVVEEEEERLKGSIFSVPLEQFVKESEEPAQGTVSKKMPWAKVEKAVIFPRIKKEKVITSAELTLPKAVLARLRSNAKELRMWVKAKKAGVTQAVVDEISLTWRRSELAMVKFVDPLSRNMERARVIVETKTGGLVVWSKNDTLVVYRGNSYQQTSKANCASVHPDGQESTLSKRIYGKSENHPPASSVQSYDVAGVSTSLEHKEDHFLPTSLVSKINEGTEYFSGTLYEREANRLLNGLGPRFIDWWWSTPLPVDADLLPETVLHFRTPFRLCPPCVRPKLTDDELTYLRKLAHPLPTHFALGKNTKLQGLAAAIIKLWEKSPIAKIAVKRGIPNTNNEQMSSELKRLTGGILILRNKFFIIMYRGKDFLPGSVAYSLSVREKELENLQLQEEQARFKSIESFHSVWDTQYSMGSIGTYMEFYNIQEHYGYQREGNLGVNTQIEAEKEMLQKELRKHEHRLLLLQMKIEGSEKVLAKLSSKCRPPDQAADQELLTEEERQVFRKIGLKMDEFMLMGRRGIFDGVIINIHLHWKHREIVKVVSMQRTISQVMSSAKQLEIESGGILIGVEKQGRGYAIIIYRGKNYGTPLNLLPGNLLTKREALQRSIEIQRRGSLKYFAYRKRQAILELKHKIVSSSPQIFYNKPLESRCIKANLLELQRNLEESTKGLTPGEHLNQLPVSGTPVC